MNRLAGLGELPAGHYFVFLASPGGSDVTDSVVR
jgi:hypothetical protein